MTMPFERTRISRLAMEQIRTWALPDDILKEVYLHLTQVLPKDPEHNLSRETAPFDGMVTQFTRRDPYTQGREHEFAFLIHFGEDENTLVVVRGAYHRADDL
jgi:hypothetical protein